MKTIRKFPSLTLSVAMVFAVCTAVAQDASHHETATSQDAGDWGLLGLLGLVGLLGLRKKRSPEGPVRTDRMA